MTPAARVQAAIDILDSLFAGQPAEQCLTRWARQNRFAGSKDRAAIRDLVYDALRCARSYAALGGAWTGRGVMIGSVAAAGTPLESIFAEARYAPGPLTEDEARAMKRAEDLSQAEQLDLPNWILAKLENSYGAQVAEIAQSLRLRAPLDLRVNLRFGGVDAAVAALAEEGIEVLPIDGVPTALRVVEGARRVARSQTYLNGRVEIQDAASQFSVLQTPLPAQARVLDYCAGGGGKALAMAALSEADVFVHDADVKRMADIPARAARAAVQLQTWSGNPDQFDLVFCDAPCSGSGTWRRTPQAKWTLTETKLADYVATQRAVIAEAVPRVKPGGAFVYATCSVFAEENRDQVAWIEASWPDLRLKTAQQLLPTLPGDGFFFAIFEKS